MAKQMKPKSKRTQVKDLRVAPQALTTDDANKVKGGLVAVQKVREAAARTQPTSPKSIGCQTMPPA